MDAPQLCRGVLHWRRAVEVRRIPIMRIISRVFLISIVLCLLPSATYAGTISTDLEGLLQSLRPNEEIAVIVRLSQEANVKALKEQDIGLLRFRVINTLKNKAELTQRPLRALLESRGAKEIVPLWIVNAVAATVTAGIVPELALFPGVESVDLDEVLLAPPVELGTATIPEWNISAIKAPGLWNISFTGTGVVVANMDTGVDLNHPDLQGKWRGGTNSWFDPFKNTALPYDVDGHGTGTMGIMVGDSAGGTAIGVAPDAKWIAAKVFNDNGTSTVSTVHQAFQWLLDPDNNPATNDAPDIVNASWALGSPGACNTTFQTDIQNLRAANIAIVFGAGNSGPFPGTSISPANNPGAFAAGAVDQSLLIASFSSRGPSACDGSIFPHVVAPGVNIRTSDILLSGIPQYMSVSGTSFSSPHVAGTMALLLSAFSTLTASDLETILENGTDPFVGAPLPNNDYGHGLIDGVNAYKIAFSAIRGNIPEIAAFPPSHDFGNAKINKTSLPQVFTVVNRGIVNLNVGTVSISGTDFSDFVIGGDTCSGSTVPPLLNCTVSVAFSPLSAGLKNAALSIPSNDPAMPVLNVFLFGTGVGSDTIGVYRPSNSTFYLRISNTSGFADLVASYGDLGDIPIVGDWTGKGFDSIGVYRPSNSTFYLKNSNTSGFADLVANYGDLGDIPIVGDWTGKGFDSIGVYRPSNSTFYLKNSNTSGFADTIINYGIPGDIPVAGDWDGNGTTTIGVYRSANSTFYLRNSNTSGFADLVVNFGIPGDIPVAGDWDGNGTTTIGVYRPGDSTFYLRNSNTSGFADIIANFGIIGDSPVVGAWIGLP